MAVRKTRRRGGGVKGATPMTRNQLMKVMNEAKAASNKKQLNKLKARQEELMRILKVQKNLEDMGVPPHQTNRPRATRRR